MRTAARRGTLNAIVQTLAGLFIGALCIMLARDTQSSFVAIFAVVGPFIMVAASAGAWWMSWVMWRAVNESWGALHARVAGDIVVLGNPFNLAFGKRKNLPRGDTVTMSVRNGTGMGGVFSEWTIAGTGAKVVVKAPGPWTDQRWYELGEGLQRLGLKVVAEPEPADSHASTPGG